MSKDVDYIKELITFNWYERDGNHYCTAEHKIACEGVGEAEIVMGKRGWEAKVTYPLWARYVAALTIEETRVNLEKAIVDQLATCGRVGYLFADYWAEQYREEWEATATAQGTEQP